MTDEPARPTDPDYSRWDDDSTESYVLRVASQAIWQIGRLFCHIGDELLNAAYPNSAVDMNLDDEPTAEGNP